MPASLRLVWQGITLHFVRLPNALTANVVEEMTRSQIEAAMERNPPFKLRMADGKESVVPHRDSVSLSPPKGTYAVVFDDQDTAFVLSLLTMTGNCIGSTVARRCPTEATVHKRERPSWHLASK